LTKSLGLHQQCWFTMQPHAVVSTDEGAQLRQRRKGAQLC